MLQDAFHGDDKTSSAPFILRPNEAILHFELPNLLPEGQGLALNTKLGTLALLNNDPAALILARQQFSTSEIRVLLTTPGAIPELLS